jgi:hypothetical protein
MKLCNAGLAQRAIGFPKPCSSLNVSKTTWYQVIYFFGISYDKIPERVELYPIARFMKLDSISQNFDAKKERDIVKAVDF